METTRTLPRPLAIGLNVAGVVVALWTFFDPVPLVLAVSLSILTPLVAIVLVAGSGGDMVLFPLKRERRQYLSWMFVAPLVTLTFMAMFGLDLLEPFAAFLPTLVGAAIGGAAYGLWRLLGGQWRGAFALVLYGAIVAYAVFAETDRRLDTAQPQAFRVTVLGKHVFRRKTTTYYLDLPAWGPVKEPDSTRVSLDVYDRAVAGQDVCIALHPGFWRAPWYDLDVCPGQPPVGPVT